MKIIVDAMGGDNAPKEIVKGTLDAAAEFGLEAILVGRGEEVLRSLESLGVATLPKGVELINATEVVDMEDDPATATRVKKDSSMAVALRLLRDGAGDAVVSAGSTGALLTGATLTIKRVHGVRRAALAPMVPTKRGGAVIIDSGANAECTPEYLLQFAYMGSFYMEKLMNRERPRIGLLNIGTEKTKGCELQRAAYALLEEAGEKGNLNFIGNIEAREVLQGAADVVVCDGFTGNVLLKSLEGAAIYIFGEMKGIFSKSLFTKLSYAVVRGGVRALVGKLDYSEVGGTALVGIAKPVIKAHGASDARAFRGAVRQAVAFSEAGIADEIARNMIYMRL